MTDAQLLTQTRHALVQRAFAPPARVLGQRTSQPGLARTCESGDQHTVAAFDPVTQCQAHHSTAIKPAPRAAVNVFNARLRVLQVGRLEQARLALVTAPKHLPVYQQGKALLEAHTCHAWLGELLLQSGGHTGEFEAAQLFQCRVHHHGVFL